MLPMNEFMQAWKAERIDYKTAPYTMRTAFRKIEHVSRQEMIERTLPLIRENLLANPGGPVAFGGVEALTRIADALRGPKSNDLRDLLLHFGLPLAARRNADGAAFLREAGNTETAHYMEQQAVLYGQAQYKGAHKQWAHVADLIEQIAELEQQLIAAF
jgi:hypothetical protein